MTSHDTRGQPLTAPLIPAGLDLDPITCTWLRGLIATALERELRPLSWHIYRGKDGAVATGYVTATLLHEGAGIRSSWAQELGLTEVDDGYTGSAGALTIRLPDAIDPDDRCRICGHPFDPRDTRTDGHARHQAGETCRSCASEAQ